MNFSRIAQMMAGLVLLGTLALVLAGCRTTPKIEWASRVGNYSYDQAVTDLGPPDKMAELSDGRLVADWISRRSSPGRFSIGTGIYGGRTGVSVGQSVGTGSGDRVLRLTFDRDRQLLDWYPKSR